MRDTQPNPVLGARESLLDQRRLRAAMLVAKLSGRQRQVLLAMALGRPNKQIATDLRISQKTVENHRAKLLDRLKVRTSTAAIRLAIEAGY